MKYLPLLSLHLMHVYYADGRCPDFQIEPTLETRRLLKNHRCVLKSFSNGVRLFAAVTDSGAPFIPLHNGATFTFYLRLQNLDFPLFTDLVELTQVAAPVYTNAEVGLANPVQLTLVSHPTSQLAKGIFAEVEIHNNDSLPEITDGPGEFQIDFKAKLARWKYYVIADQTDAKSGRDEFSIVDRAPLPIVFSDGNRTHLNQNPDASDDIAEALAERYPNQRRYRFVSDDLIPCQQAARKSLQLLLDNELVLGALPNPSLRNYTIANVIGSVPTQTEDALHQIVTHLTHQFQTTGG